MKQVVDQIKPIAILLIACAVLIGGISWLMSGGASSGQSQSLIETEEEIPGPIPAEEIKAYNETMTNKNNPVAVMQTNQGIIELELFEDWMPITAGNFIKLADEGFFNGIKFHRVIEGFMIQGGDPNTKTDQVMLYGTGGPGYTIQDEHVSADILSNARGTIAMANNGQPDSGGSQFFINLVDNTNLDFDKQPLSSKHPVFGKVISGMDVVDAIGDVETGINDLPVDDVVIESVTIKRD